MTCPAMTAGPSAPGAGPPRVPDQRSAGFRGACHRSISIEPEVGPAWIGHSILGIDTEPLAQTRAEPAPWSGHEGRSDPLAAVEIVRGVGLARAGRRRQCVLCPFLAGRREAEPGAGRACQRQPTPARRRSSASPTAMKALTGRLGTPAGRIRPSAWIPSSTAVGTDPKCRGPAERQHQLATVARMRRTRYFVMSILSRCRR